MTEEASKERFGNLREAVKLGTAGIEAIGRETVERDFQWDRPGAANPQSQTAPEKKDEGDFVELYRKGDRGLRDALDEVKEELLEHATKS